VRLELDSGFSGSRLLNPIVATVRHRVNQTVHFVRAQLPSGGDSPVIVFDGATNAWSLDGDGHSEGLMGALSGAAVTDVFDGNGQSTVCTLTPSYLTIENATGSSKSAIYGTWTALVETNDIAPFGVSGWGKCYKIGLVGYSSANTSYLLTSWLSRNQAAADDTATLTLSDSSGADFPFIARAPANVKCSSVRVRLEWSDRNTFPSAIILAVEPSDNLQRTPSTRKV
jgi:hypothetical protein